MSQRNLHAAQELLEAIGEAPVSISCERVTSKPGWSGPESQAAGGCTHRQWLQVDPRGPLFSRSGSWQIVDARLSGKLQWRM